MQKRFLVLCVFLLVLLTSAAASASAKITDVKWGVNRYNELRFTVDLTENTSYKVEVEGRDLTIKVSAGMSPNLVRRGYVRSDMARSFSIERDGSKTLVKVPLTKEITEQQYRTFALKPDRKTGRPQRIVVDITANRKDSGSASSGSAARSYSSTVPVVNYRTSGGIEDKVITIDPGHGGSDPGAIGLNGTREKMITLQIAEKLQKLLQDAGAKVNMTRTTDIDVYGTDATDAQELQARVDVGTKNQADLFLSVHINANENRSVGGISTYYYPKTDYDSKLAGLIQDRLAASFTGVTDLGVRQAGFYVIKRSSMPAILAEICFISNPREEKLLQSRWFQLKVARAIADGVIEYFK